MIPDKLKICIVGGGNSTHTLVPLLSDAGHVVNLLTRRPGEWTDMVSVSKVSPDGKVEACLTGRIATRSSRPEDVVPGCNVIFLSLPVSKYRLVLDQIGPWIDRDRKVIIGTIYGQGGFNWMVDEVKAKFGLPNVVMFACGLVPWITRTASYGKEGLTYGSKSVNVVAVSPKEDFLKLNNLLLNDLCYRWFKQGKFEQADNFLSLTLSVDNQIIHLARMYGLFLKSGGVWNEKADVPLFYKDFDDTSADVLREVDADYERIREKIRLLFPDKAFKYMLDYLSLERLTYQTTNTDIKVSFTSSKTLGQIATPVVPNAEGKWVFDKTHRFFEDDVYYGLCIAKWIAEKTNVETKAIDRILAWAQVLLGDNIIKGDELCLGRKEAFKSGLPSEYGFTTIDDIVD
jgi:hypothetical protein